MENPYKESEEVIEFIPIETKIDMPKPQSVETEKGLMQQVPKGAKDREIPAGVNFVPGNFAAKTAEGNTKKAVNEVEKKTTTGAILATKETTDSKTDIKVMPTAQMAIESSKSEAVNFTPVDLSPLDHQNKTKLASQILSNEIPWLDLVSEKNMLSNTSDKFITFVPVEVKTKKRKWKGTTNKKEAKVGIKEKQLMKLLVAVENMNKAETRATIIKRNRKKRRRQKQRRERKRQLARKRMLEKKHNSVLRSDGFHASTPQSNFLKKKFYSRCQ